MLFHIDSTKLQTKRWYCLTNTKNEQDSDLIKKKEVQKKLQDKWDFYYKNKLNYDQLLIKSIESVLSKLNKAKEDKNEISLA